MVPNTASVLSQPNYPLPSAAPQPVNKSMLLGDYDWNLSVKVNLD